MTRRRKLGITIGVLLLILGGVLIAGDRVAVGVAEGQIADQVAAELVERGMTTTGPPSVEIGGFPFLTQVYAGEYEKISIDVDRPLADEVTLDRLVVEASAVRADTASVLDGTGSVTADRVTGTATMGWDAVRRALEIANLPGIDPAAVDVSVKDHNVELRLPLSLLGQRITLIGTGSLEVSDGMIRLTIATLTTEGGQLPPAAERLIEQYRSQLSVTLNIPDLPFQLVVNSVTTRTTGLVIVASAEHVTLAG